MSVFSTKKLLLTFISLQPKSAWSFKHITRSETNSFTHSYHRYPAKFIPNIVEKLLLDLTKKGEVVLDPFGGCGTTLVESKRLGRKSIGFDINPVAKFIAEVKVTPINPLVLSSELHKLEKRLTKTTRAKSSLYLKNERIAYWFDTKTINELNFLYSEIKKIENKNVRKFFLCAFSHNLKNCSRWLMKSIKPTVDKNKKIPNVLNTFMKHAKSMSKKNSMFYLLLKNEKNLRTSSTILLRDSTRKFPIQDNKIDLIITSPPYVTSYEYADLHQLSLLWFAHDKKNFSSWHSFAKNFIDFKRKFIGTSHKNKQSGEMGSKIGEEIVEKLNILDKTLSKNVSNYFIDMNLAFIEMYRVLKPQKNACIVIGNTELRGVPILNAEVATEQMLKIGFKNPKIIKREVPNKMITPWRDISTGKFTGMQNPNKKCAYEYEYILIMEK